MGAMALSLSWRLWAGIIPVCLFRLAHDLATTRRCPWRLCSTLANVTERRCARASYQRIYACSGDVNLERYDRHFDVGRYICCDLGGGQAVLLTRRA